MKRLQEHFVHKDGVWLIPFSHLNADAVKVQVWINDKQVTEKSFTYGYHPNGNGNLVKDALAYAHELAEEHNLPIIDGSGVEYFTFPSEYRRTEYRTHDSWKPVVDDPDVEEYKYTDQELDDMDERPRQTVKWAICKGPNLFDIYDNVTKNPDRMWDTDMFRGMCGDSGDVVSDFKKFFAKNADKVYEGTWEDIKDGNYVVIVHNRRYTSKSIKKTFDAIIAAGLEVNGKKITGKIYTGEYEKKSDWSGDYEDEIVISFDDVPKISSSSERDTRNSVIYTYTKVYDALTCAGMFFPEEFTVVHHDPYDEKDTEEYTFQIDDNDVLHVGPTKAFETFKTLKVGDVVKKSTSTWAYDKNPSAYYVVIEVGAKTAKVARCSERYQTHSHSRWGASEYDYDTIVSPVLYQNALDGKYTTDLVWNGYKHKEKDAVETINLVDHENYTVAYRAGSKELMDAFINAMVVCKQAQYFYKDDPLKKHAPENPEEFFGEPLHLVVMSSWDKERYFKKQETDPLVKDLIISMVEGSKYGFEKTKEGPDKDGDLVITYENKKAQKLVFGISKDSLDYRIHYYAGDEKHGWGSEDAKEFEEDLTACIEKYVKTKKGLN